MCGEELACPCSRFAVTSCRGMTDHSHCPILSGSASESFPSMQVLCCALFLCRYTGPSLHSPLRASAPGSIVPIALQIITYNLLIGSVALWLSSSCLRSLSDQLNICNVSFPRGIGCEIIVHFCWCLLSNANGNISSQQLQARLVGDTSQSSRARRKLFQAYQNVGIT